MDGRQRIRAIACFAVLACAACGREGTWTTLAAQTTEAEPTAPPTPTPTPEPTAEPETPRPKPVQAAAPAPAARTPPPIPSSELPGGPDGSDETKRDSGVRGQVVTSSGRPIADAVVFVKGDGFQSNSTTGGAGRFHIHAPAGSYLVGARANNASVRCDDEVVKVPETSFTTITIGCTGSG